MYKRNIILLISFIILDVIGFVSLYFGIITHGILFMFIGTGVYSFIINYYEKNGKVFPYLFKAILAVFITSLSVCGWFYSYNYIAHLMFPNGI